MLSEKAIEKLKAVVEEVEGKVCVRYQRPVFSKLAVDAYCSLFSGSCTIINVRIKEGIVRAIARKKGS